MPDWLSIIEDSQGGSGNFADEPSPITIAFWLYGNQTSQDIEIPNGASSISLYYSSAYSITLSAYDANGTLLNSTTGPPNFDTATGVYDIWSPLSVTAPNGGVITSLNVSGFANYTGIDNLNVCQAPSIASVELTQAIQQYQTLADLKASLAANGEPPVPVISGKPAVLRTYFNAVQDVTNLTVQLSGVSPATKSLAIQPNCTPNMQRAQSGGCQSADFYFTPPSGSWTATLDVFDSSGNQVEEEALPFTSTGTDSLRLRGVSVCDAKDSGGNWLCADASDLLTRTGLIAKIAPTSAVTTNITNSVVQNDIATTNANAWWPATASQVAGLYGILDYLGDALLGRYTTYFGMVRPAPLPPIQDPLGGVGGIANGIPSHGAIGRTSALRFQSNTETTVEVVAHETGHTLGLKHTNTQLPFNLTAPPACYNFAGDDSTDWQFPTGIPGSESNTNYIQSAAINGLPTYEVGFDVAGRIPINPNSTFEVMSYCSPRWISPQRYQTMIATLGGVFGASRSNSGRDKKATSSIPQPFWIVGGTIQSPTVVFQPLFELTTQGDTGTDSGTYSLVVEDSSGTALFTRQFTPQTATTETSGQDLSGPPVFTQMIPVTVGAAAIVLIGPQNTELGRITLGGTPPIVSITSPTSGFVGVGVENVTWTVNGPSSYTSIVLYSPDNGTTWSQVGEVANIGSMAVNFDLLPGSNQAIVKVLVSDGVNTGTATSVSFVVPKKSPQFAAIESPAANFAQPSVDPVYFTGTAYDVDDGVLTGSALQWSSNIQGSLGSGSPLSVKLKPGNHTITLTATDSDHNAISTSVSIVIGGNPPLVSLQIQSLNTGSNNCELATVGATPGTNGAPLSQVQYSVDGGNTYATIPLTGLPYDFIVPGSGFLHVVARAYDISGQSAAQDASFFTQGVCTLTATTTALVSSLNPSVAGQPVTFTATVKPTQQGGGTPTGTVTFFDGATALGNVPLSSSSQAAYVTSTLAIGTHSITATYSGDANFAPSTSVVVSQAVTGSPVVTLTPTSLTFPTQVIFTTSKAQTVTLTNTGQGVLDITKLGDTGTPLFSLTNNCHSTMNPGASCKLSVTFRPTTIGVLAGLISITDNAPLSPQEVTLIGTGTAFQFIPASLNFGNQTVGTQSPQQTITLSNNSRADVSITSISIIGRNAGDFIQTNTCGGSLAESASCSITVVFKPLAKGNRAAAVSVNDDGGGSPQNVSLAGTGK